MQAIREAIPFPGDSAVGGRVVPVRRRAPALLAPKLGAAILAAVVLIACGVERGSDHRGEAVAGGATTELGSSGTAGSALGLASAAGGASGGTLASPVGGAEAEAGLSGAPPAEQGVAGGGAGPQLDATEHPAPGVDAGCGDLIDDMEDGDEWLCLGAGRIGKWYLYRGWGGPGEGPPADPILPEILPEPRGESLRAMHAVRDSFEWGSRLGVDLAFDGTQYGLYDASRYSALRFWAMAELGAEVCVGISTASTTWEGYGGTLELVQSSSIQEVTFEIGSRWVQYTVPFAGFSELDQVINVQFVGKLDEPGFWIDDLEFVE